MPIVIDVLHVIACVGLIAVIMLQVTKSEGSSGGAGLGWGTIGGKSTASVNVPVGVERILQPLTTWLALTFLVTAALNAVPPVPEARYNSAVSVLGGLYLVSLIWGRKAVVWLRRAFGDE